MQAIEETQLFTQLTIIDLLKKVKVLSLII